MDDREVRDYVERVRSRRRFWRRWGTAGAVVTVLLLLAAVTLGPVLGCDYWLAREGAVVPDLRGLTLSQARERLDDCLPLVVVDERRAPEVPAGAVLEQRPGVTQVLHDREPVEVVISTGPSPAAP